MARGTVLSEIVLEGDRSFRQSIRSSGERMDEAASDAGTLSGALSTAGNRMGSVRTDALQVAGALAMMDNRAGEAEDELDSLSRSAASTSGTFGTLSLSTEGASIAMGSFSTVLVGSVIPSVLTLSTILAPLAATFATVATAAGSLAGVFGAIVGSGYLAWGQQLAQQNKQQLQQVRSRIGALEDLRDRVGDLTTAQRQRLRQLKEQEQQLDDATSATGALSRRFAQLGDEIAAAIIPFGKQFIPLVKDATNALPGLVRSIIEAIGPTEQFRESLRNLGGLAQEALPAIAARLFELAERALPVFNDAVAWMSENAGPAFDELVATTEELAPEFRGLLDAVAELAPELLDFGTEVATVVVPALEDMVSAGDDLLTTVNSLDPAMQDLTISTALLAPVLLKAASTLASLGSVLSGAGLVSSIGGLSGAVGSLGTVLSALTGPLGIVIALVAGFAAAFATNFGNVRTIVNQTKSAIVGDLQRLKPVFRGLVQFVGGIASALGDIWDVIGDDVATVVRFMTDYWSGLITTFTDFVTTLIVSLSRLAAGDGKGFLLQWAGFVERAFAGLGDFVEQWGAGLYDTITTWMERAINTVIEGLNTLIRKRNQLVRQLPKQLRERFIVEQAPTLDRVTLPDLAAPTDPAAPPSPRRQNTEQRRERLEMKLDGRLTVEDGEVVALIDERIELDNNRTDRKVKRLNERGL